MSRILLFPLIAVDGGQSAKYSLKVMFNSLTWSHMGSKYSITLPVAQLVKNLPSMLKTRVRSLGQEDLLEKGMATHSSILAWRIPWIEELSRLQSMALQKLGHD